MRLLCVYKPSKPEGTALSPEAIAAMGEFVEKSFKSGWLLATEGCLPSAAGARVRRAGEKVTVTDGPFTEAKELIGGFALIQADSKAQAIEYTKQFLHVAGDGETEIRQICDAPPNATR